MATVLRKPDDRTRPPVDGDPWADDVTRRLNAYAVFLTRALAADPHSFVLCIDAEWGLGKTFFVKRWASSLATTDHKCVAEFNAWQHDTSDDPLLPFVASVTEQLRKHLDRKRKVIDTVKKQAGKIALRTGGILVRAGLRKLLGDKGPEEIKNLLDSDSEGELTELAGSLVDDALAKQKARETFREDLNRLVERIPAEKKPVFVFIDELDRCNPAFAVQLLERVKHLFDVDGIKFIVSADTTQLAHSICGAYGHEFDGNTYLQRFFDQTFALPKPNAAEFAKMLFASVNLGELNSAIIVCSNDSDESNESSNSSDSPENDFAELSECFRLSLRQQQQIFSRLMATLPNIVCRCVHFTFLAGLMMLRLRMPKMYRRYLTFLDNPGKKDPVAKLQGVQDFVAELNRAVANPSGNAYLILAKYLEWHCCDHNHLPREFSTMDRQSDQRPSLGQPPPSKRLEKRLMYCLGKICSDLPDFKRYPHYIEMAAHFAAEDA